MRPAERHAVRVSGPEDGQVMLFAHGFGCDQNMWRLMTPHFERHYRVITFDHAGAGSSAPDSFDPVRHGSLQGYADDVLDVCRDLALEDVIFVGHSVSAMIGALAVIREPERFASLVMVGPSPRYVDDEGYVGGFSEEDIRELLESLESNYLGWASTMAPIIMGNKDRPELGEELTESFCRTDPAVARSFARVTFLSDNRADLARVSVPTLVIQCKDDVIAPMEVGEYVTSSLPDASLAVLDATGHCPQLSAPDATAEAIGRFLAR